MYVHTVNFVKGKTTLERYGKSSDHDDSTKMTFSGIQDDATIYRASQIFNAQNSTNNDDASKLSNRISKSIANVLSVDLES